MVCDFSVLILIKYIPVSSLVMSIVSEIIPGCLLIGVITSLPRLSTIIIVDL